MKTNVSIKFNSIEEYREIEKKLEELGYVNDKEWNEEELTIINKGYECYVSIDDKPTDGNSTCLFTIFDFVSDNEKTYNNLEEFLNY